MSQSIQELCTLVKKTSDEKELSSLSQRLQKTVNTPSLFLDFANNHGGIEILKNFLKMKNSVVRRRACALIANAAGDEVGQILRKNGIIDALLRIIERYNEEWNDEQVIRNAVVSVMNLAMDDLNREYFIQRKGFLIAFIDCLDTYKTNEEISNYILIIFSTCASNKNLSKEIIKEKEILDFVSTFLAKSKDIGIIESCIAFLWNLCQDPENIRILQSRKGLLANIESYTACKDESVRRNASKVYSLLTDLLEESSLTKMLSDLKNGGHKAVLKACMSLSKFISGDETNKKKLVKSDGIDVLSVVLNDFDDEEIIHRVVFVLCTLSVSDIFALKMRKVDLISRLSALLSQTEYTEIICDNIMTLFYNMSTLEACRPDLRENGLIKAMIPLMDSKIGSKRSKAVSILQNMSLDDKSGEILLKESGIMKLYEITSESKQSDTLTLAQKNSIHNLWKIASTHKEEDVNEENQEKLEDMEDDESYEWKELISDVMMDGTKLVETSEKSPGSTELLLQKKPKKFDDQPSFKPEITLSKLPGDGSELTSNIQPNTSVDPEKKVLQRKTSITSTVPVSALENSLAIKLKQGPNGLNNELKKKAISSNLELKLAQGPKLQTTTPIPVQRHARSNSQSLPETGKVSRDVKSVPEGGNGFISNITRLFTGRRSDGSSQPYKGNKNTLGIHISSLDSDGPVEFMMNVDKPSQESRLHPLELDTIVDTPLHYTPTDIPVSPSMSPREPTLQKDEDYIEAAIERRRRVRVNKVPGRKYENDENSTNSPRDVDRRHTVQFEPLPEKNTHSRSESRAAESKEFTKTSHYLETVKKISEGLTKTLQEGITTTILKTNVEFRLNDDFSSFHGGSFREIRKHAQMDEGDYLQSICTGSWKIVITPGKSGALLFFTADSKYLLKTLTNGEQRLLNQMMPDYCQFIQKNPDTLLVKFLGMYSVKYQKRTLHIVVMNNIFETNRPDETYDLKGSTIGRNAREGERILKDLDLINSKKSLNLTERQKIQFLKQISKDSDFLAKNKIMDYSMLLGIKKSNDIAIKFDTKGKGQFQCVQSVDGSETYFMGIIDILQLWNLRKKAELQVKSLANDKHGLSSLPPIEYSIRFQNFVKNITLN